MTCVRQCSHRRPNTKHNFTSSKQGCTIPVQISLSEMSEYILHTNDRQVTKSITWLMPPEPVVEHMEFRRPRPTVAPEKSVALISWALSCGVLLVRSQLRSR